MFLLLQVGDRFKKKFKNCHIWHTTGKNNNSAGMQDPYTSKEEEKNPPFTHSTTTWAAKTKKTLSKVTNI